MPETASSSPSPGASDPEPSAPLPLAVVIGGVSGSGKTTVGAEVARQLGARFLDADDFHPRANIEKMARSEPLDDEDRRPWLAALNQALASHLEAGETVVLACSALKRRYRDRLTAGLPEVQLFMLSGDKTVLANRIGRRADHFMPATLLDSQLSTLEPLDQSLERGRSWTVDVDRPVSAIVAEITSRITAVAPLAGLSAEARPGG